MFEAIITTLGAAKIADAIANDEPISLTTGQVGDGNGNATDPDPSDTELVRSVFSTTLNRVDIDQQDETRIIAEFVIPADEGGFVIREAGIFDGDGDMIAVTQFPEVYKPTDAEGATLDLTIRLYIVVASTSAITLLIDTSVTIATREWVISNYGNIPGGTTGQVLTKVTNANGDYEWTDPTDVNVTVDIVEEEQTLSAAQTIVTLAVCTTENASIFIEGIRLHPDDWTATDETTITLTSSYAAGSKIYILQNEPVGGATYLERSANLADLQDKTTARANLELLTNSTYLQALTAEINKLNYPVGEILITRRAGNPGTFFGFGTWVAYGAGRVLVGHDAANGNFDAVDKTGGAETHQLTTAELPAHSHTTGVFNLTSGYNTSNGTNTVPANATTRPSTSTGNTGGGLAHNNLQPYITVFMWRRTA